MKKALELSRDQMKNIFGGDNGNEQTVLGYESSKHCFVDGEIIFELICTDPSQCQMYYGPAAECR